MSGRKGLIELDYRIAGTDTTSHTLTSALCLLLNNPSKLKALEKEIQTAFPNEIDDITFARTQDLPYLNAVINESLRRMPVVLGGKILISLKGRRVKWTADVVLKG